MAVTVHRRGDGGMTQPRLNRLWRQLETTILLRPKAPGRIKVPECMHAGVFRVTGLCNETGRIAGRNESTFDDGWQTQNLGFSCRENQLAWSPEFHCLSSCARCRGIGTFRFPARDFGALVTPYLSARSLTRISPAEKSTLADRNAQFG